MDLMIWMEANTVASIVICGLILVCGTSLSGGRDADLMDDLDDRGKF